MKNKDYEILNIHGKKYYHRLTKNRWQGGYNYDSYVTHNKHDKNAVVSYEEYVNYLKEISLDASEEIKPFYNDTTSNYVILSYSDGQCWCSLDLIDYIEESDKIKIIGDEAAYADGFKISTTYICIIPTNKPVGATIEFNECYNNEEIRYLKKYGKPYDITLFEKSKSEDTTIEN